jgi:hypothetical protein
VRPPVPPPPQRDRPPDPQEARPSPASCQARRCRPRRRLQGSSRWRPRGIQEEGGWRCQGGIWRVQARESESTCIEVLKARSENTDVVDVVYDGFSGNVVEVRWRNRPWCPLVLNVDTDTNSLSRLPSSRLGNAFGWTPFARYLFDTFSDDPGVTSRLFEL